MENEQSRWGGREGLDGSNGCKRVMLTYRRNFKSTKKKGTQWRGKTTQKCAKACSNATQAWQATLLW
jgi:hypothetical protein